MVYSEITREKFLEILRNNNIDTEIVAFDDSLIQGYYCVRKNYYRWEVVSRERGTEFEVIGFPSESNALQYLLDILILDHSHIPH